jgi:hypothetical protein
MQKQDECHGGKKKCIQNFGVKQNEMIGGYKFIFGHNAWTELFVFVKWNKMDV